MERCAEDIGDRNAETADIGAYMASSVAVFKDGNASVGRLERLKSPERRNFRCSSLRRDERDGRRGVVSGLVYVRSRMSTDSRWVKPLIGANHDSGIPWTELIRR